jgi:hypothetical protein
MAARNNTPGFFSMPLRTWLTRNWIVLALPTGLFLLLRTYHTPAFAHQRARFTLGILTQQRLTETGSRLVEFRFTVHKVAYTGATAYPAQTNRDSLVLRCLVEYDSLDPRQNVGHFAITIPDSIRQAPANGWQRPPFPVPLWILDHGKLK